MAGMECELQRVLFLRQQIKGNKLWQERDREGEGKFLVFNKHRKTSDIMRKDDSCSLKRQLRNNNEGLGLELTWLNVCLAYMDPWVRSPTLYKPDIGVQACSASSNQVIGGWRTNTQSHSKLHSELEVSLCYYMTPHLKKRERSVVNK